MIRLPEFKLGTYISCVYLQKTADFSFEKKPFRSHMFSLIWEICKEQKKLTLEQNLDISLVNSSLFVVYMLSLKILFYFYVIENGSDRLSIAMFLASSVSFFGHNFPKCGHNGLKF